MNRLSGWTRDPLIASLTLFGTLIAAGFVSVVLGWRIVARYSFVPDQVPAIVSGGIGGLSLIIFGAAMLDVQVRRWHAAQERELCEDILDAAAELLDLEDQSA